MKPPKLDLPEMDGKSLRLFAVCWNCQKTAVKHAGMECLYCQQYEPSKAGRPRTKGLVDEMSIEELTAHLGQDEYGNLIEEYEPDIPGQDSYERNVKFSLDDIRGKLQVDEHAYRKWQE